MSNIQDLLSDLTTAEPALARLQAEHVAENGELLPHVLFGDVTPWIIAHAPATHVLAILERHMTTGDDDVTNVIALSFLEGLEDVGVRAALGPRLAAQLAAMESWTPWDPDPSAE